MEYLFSVLPHLRAYSSQRTDELEVETLLSCEASSLTRPVVRLRAQGANTSLTLPLSFYENPACLATLRLAGLRYISVRLVCWQDAPLYVRVYVDSAAAAQEVAEFGTLRASAKWHELLRHVQQGPFRESMQPCGIAHLGAEADLRHWLAITGSEALELGLPFSLDEQLGTMQFASFDTPAVFMHGPQGPHTTGSTRKAVRGGVLCLPYASPACLALCLQSIPQGTGMRIPPPLGATRIPVPCTLVLLDARRALPLAPVPGVLVIRTLQDAQGVDLPSLHQLRAVVLCVASEDGATGVTTTALREWEQAAVQTFVQASARAGLGADGLLPLHFEALDQTRYFVRHCPHRKGWGAPWTLLQWERLIVDCDIDTHPYPALAEITSSFSADIRLALLEDAEALLGPLAWLGASRACAAAGLPALNAHHPGLFASLQAHSVAVRVAPGDPPRVRALHARSTQAEAQVRQTLLMQHPLPPGLPTHCASLRVALGAHPTPISYEKSVAAVHGMPRDKLAALLDEFAGSPQLEFARDQLRKLGAGDAETCCVCMSEPPTIMSFCGHLYCAECAQELQRSQEFSASDPSTAYSKCCVCRTPTYADDWWKLCKEPAFVRPMMLETLLGMRRDKPVLVVTASVVDAMMLCARVHQSLGEGFSVVHAQYTSHDTAPSQRLAAKLASKHGFVVCAATDLCAQALVLSDVRELVIVSAGGPCALSSRDGSALPHAYQPWLPALIPIIYPWSCAQRLKGIETSIVVLGHLNAEALALELQDALSLRDDDEPERAPRAYDLRSKAKRHTCTGATLRESKP